MKAPFCIPIVSILWLPASAQNYILMLMVRSSVIVSRTLIEGIFIVESVP